VAQPEVWICSNVAELVLMNAGQVVVVPAEAHADTERTHGSKDCVAETLELNPFALRCGRSRTIGQSRVQFTCGLPSRSDSFSQKLYDRKKFESS
jgi:hypothetical protein